MKKTVTKIEANENVSLAVTFYEIELPKAIIQIVHGMTEHQQRYEKLAIRLCEAGYNVVTSDLRGHGSSCENEECYGFFGTKKGYLNLIDDQKLITKMIIEKYPFAKIYMFAHSMGTLIARNYLKTNDVYVDKLILSGAPNYQSASHLGKLVASTISFFHGKKSHSKFLEKLTTGAFNKKINGQIENEWLSYNTQNVAVFNDDALCGFCFTTQGYKDLYSLVAEMHKPKKYDLNNKSLPILFLAGCDDPCIGGVKGFNCSINTLKKAGYEDISSKLYPMMRHEIINEQENEVVYKDIIEFYDK